MEFQFSTEYIENRDGKSWSVVPEDELRECRHLANMIGATSPANCLHPADSLQAFELIPDACVCGECHAVLKNYGPREAKALHIEPGLRKLDAELLQAEIYQAIRPVFRAVDDIRSATSPYGSANDAMQWADAVDSRNPLARALNQVR